MARPRKKPKYDPNSILNELLNAVVDEHKKILKQNNEVGEIKTVAAELDIGSNKARKLLITAGIRDGEEYYYNQTSRQILTLYNEGKKVSEIMAITGLTRTSVCCYIPYSKGLYNAKELSLDAERIRHYRRRQQRCKRFMTEIAVMDDEDANAYLWETLKELEGCVFRTSGRGNNIGIEFRYKIKGGELFVSRKAKSITKSTVLLAFAKAREIQNEIGFVSGPKKIGTFGASYLYPIFLRLGICTQQAVTERTFKGE